MRIFTLQLDLDTNEVNLLLNTDWGEEEHDEEEKYKSLIKKGLIRGEYIFETLMTYHLTDAGKQVVEEIRFGEELPEEPGSPNQDDSEEDILP